MGKKKNLICFFFTLEQTNLSTTISEIEAWKVNE